MNAHVFIEFINRVEERDKMLGKPRTSLLIPFPQLV